MAPVGRAFLRPGRQRIEGASDCASMQTGLPAPDIGSHDCRDDVRGPGLTPCDISERPMISRREVVVGSLLAHRQRATKPPRVIDEPGDEASS